LVAAAELLNTLAFPPSVDEAVVVRLVALAAPKVGVVSVGLVASTTLPLPVVVAAVSCDDALLLNTLALAGTLPPLILLTVVALCVPVTSPLKLPVKLAALGAGSPVVAWPHTIAGAAVKIKTHNPRFIFLLLAILVRPAYPRDLRATQASAAQLMQAAPPTFLH
jgi:hypothetical protein